MAQRSADPSAPQQRKAKLRRPGFARPYPASPQLDELLASFQAGNHQVVRERAQQLARDTKDPDVGRAAEDLQRRLRPGRLATYLFLLPVGLLLVLLMHYLLGTH